VTRAKAEDEEGGHSGDRPSAEQAAVVEDAVIREAIARSLNDLVPADNALPMDAVLAWSRQEWEREEAEQQRWLL
jgi:hypothetical protein